MLGSDISIEIAVPKRLFSSWQMFVIFRRRESLGSASSSSILHWFYKPKKKVEGRKVDLGTNEEEELA